MDLNEIRRCDEHPDVDFSDETEIARFVRPKKWLALDVGKFKVLRINVRTLFALFWFQIVQSYRLTVCNCLARLPPVQPSSHTAHTSFPDRQPGAGK